MHLPPDIYESGRLLDEYLLFHYGSAGEILPALDGGDSRPPWLAAMESALGLPVRTAAWFGPDTAGSALDLGCAVGRSSFELSHECERVLGVDFSHSFVRAANHLREGGKLPYRRHDEGHESTDLTASAPPDACPERVVFEQGDAMNLRPDIGVFDRVHAANLLCRLPDPVRLLDRLPELVRPGGELVLATPCTWLEEFTPPEAWPAGSTFGWLRGKLGSSFDLLRSGHEPFLIRETARKFQFTLSQVTLWRRKADPDTTV